MIKYPELYTVKQFFSITSAVPEILDLTGFIQPKYDGSNITCFVGVCLSRNLNKLPPNFADGLKRALGTKYNTLMRLANTYQVFLELGGYKNSPAGYSKPWRGDWDYRVFDLFAGGFLLPDKVMKTLENYGLDYVGYIEMKVEDIVASWKQILSEKFGDYEGFVLKIYPPSEIIKKIKHHRQYNAIIVKFKHEYIGEHVKKPKPRKKREHVKEGKPMLPVSEIMGAINKAHMVLGDEIHDKKKAMPLIFKLVRDEAEKHGNTVPSASTLYKLYLRYLERLKEEK